MHVLKVRWGNEHKSLTWWGHLWKVNFFLCTM